MPIVQADRLTRIGAALLEAAGASDEEANAVAVGCVNANLAGHDSHGVIAIPTYIDRIKAGHIATLDSRNGLPCDTVLSMIADDNGSIKVLFKGSAPDGLDEVRGEFWDIGRMTQDLYRKRVAAM